MKPLIAFLLTVWLAGGGAAQEQEKPQTQDQQSKEETPAQPPPPARAADIRGAAILSDTRGFDFGPYLARIVSVVRRNWYAEIPESARLGEKGRVAIVFEILKDGSVPQLRVVASSGSEPLDRAAQAGIRTSTPFPPLPPEFTGNHLVVQFVFLYNLAASGGSGEGSKVLGGVVAAPGAVGPASNGPGSGGGTGGGPYAVGGDVSGPIAIYQPMPAYSEEARQAKHEGTVVLWIVVKADGSVSDVRLVKPLGMGLDEKAVQAVSKWKFHPATRDGVPVPAPMSVAFRFGPSYRTPQEDAQAFSAAGFKSAEPAAEAGPTGAPAPQNPPAPAGTDGKDFSKGAYRVGEGVSAPIPIYQPMPAYSEEARHAKLEGTVVLWIVVDNQGHVSDVRVQKSLGKGLDEKAVETVKTWKFIPGMRNGVPVPVLMAVEVLFRLM